MGADTENSPDREIWTVDSETDPFKYGRRPKPFIWGAYNGSEYHEFATGKELVDFLRPRECLVYAHNGGKFDWHFILDQLEPESEMMLIAGRIAKFRIGNAEFRDSWNIIPVAQGKLTAKTEIEDFSIFEESERDKPHNREIIRERLRRDCIGLYQDMVMPFIREFGLHLTQASASMKAWAKITREKPPKTDATFYHELKDYYYGGRVQCFHTGEIHHPFKIIDINSAYPRAMLEMHPYGDRIETSASLPTRREGVQRSFITLTAESRGALPFRDDADSLVFPDDGVIRQFNVTGWEYLAALDTGYLRKCHILSVKTLPLTIEFNAYMDYFYAMKAEAKRVGDKTRYEFAKRFYNSLYGKFGANAESYEEYKIVEPCYIHAAMQDGYDFCAELPPWALVARPLPEHKQHFYNVATAASITGWVRAYMWRSSRQVQGLLYMDTDCLWCTDSGDLKLDNEKLGYWSVDAECDYGAIAGKKMYAARTVPTGKYKTACKGVKLTASEIIRAARGEIVTYIPDAPTFSVRKGVTFTPRNITRS